MAECHGHLIYIFFLKKEKNIERQTRKEISALSHEKLKRVESGIAKNSNGVNQSKLFLTLKTWTNHCINHHNFACTIVHQITPQNFKPPLTFFSNPRLSISPSLSIKPDSLTEIISLSLSLSTFLLSLFVVVTPGAF